MNIWCIIQYMAKMYFVFCNRKFILKVSLLLVRKKLIIHKRMKEGINNRDKRIIMRNHMRKKRKENPLMDRDYRRRKKNKEENVLDRLKNDLKELIDLSDLLFTLLFETIASDIPPISIMRAVQKLYSYDQK